MTFAQESKTTRQLGVFCAVILLIPFLAAGCTQNVRVRAWGGTADMTLDEGQKLVNVTWKESQMWILTRPMHPNEKAEDYTFYERSSFGILQGAVKIHEHK